MLISIFLSAFTEMIRFAKDEALLFSLSLALSLSVSRAHLLLPCPHSLMLLISFLLFIPFSQIN